MTGIPAGHLLVLTAVANREVFATSAGFEVNGMPADLVVKHCLDVLWLEDLVDAELTVDENPQLLVLTDAGREWLARAERESQR